VAVAATIIIGSLLLFGGALVAGHRKRTLRGDRPADPDEARETYRKLRSGAIFSVVAIPCVCVAVVIYSGALLGAALIVGGIAISALSGIPAERQLLANMREQAEHT
jgi:hypothetical protein